MANELSKRGEKLVTGGTDTHLVMWDLRPHGISGGKMQEILDLMNITTNKNSVVGDTSALTPGGIRLGTGAMTTRGMVEKDMVTIVDYLMQAVAISKRTQEATGKKLVDFVKAIKVDEEVLEAGKKV